ncbi:MAG: hypothetical protein ACI9FJ_001814 [Alteromonadaceae bacterium]|jgi:hypothetical protein
MVTTMHNTKIAIENAKRLKWCEGCLVISEADAKTILVYDAALLQSPLMKSAANIANRAIEKLTESVN